MQVLNLTLKKKYFDEILSGKKIKEYREYKPYWINRLFKKEYDTIKFTNGYSKNSPYFLIELKDITVELVYHEVFGRSILCYVLHLGKIIKI
jgi:hypothetical protein